MVGHAVLLGCSASRGVNSKWGVDGVIEDGVGNQTTGVVRLALVIQFDGVAGRATDGAVTKGLTFQLVGVKGLDISAVILVEVG